MSNTSATGGFIQPNNTPAPLTGNSLEDFLFDLVAGFTGLGEGYIFPRWQEEPANLPDVGETWIAFGVVNVEADDFAVTAHDGTGDGKDTLIRHEILTTLTSVYGPNCDEVIARLRDNFMIESNREVLILAGMAYVDCGRINPMPSLVKERWLKRLDIEIRIRRVIKREYPILNLLSASAIVDNEMDIVTAEVTFNP